MSARRLLTSVAVRGQIIKVCLKRKEWRCDSTWVGDHDDDAVRTVSDDLRDNVLEDVDISLDEVQPALAFLLTDSRCHHHDAGVCSYRVI